MTKPLTDHQKRAIIFAAGAQRKRVDLLETVYKSAVYAIQLDRSVHYESAKAFHHYAQMRWHSFYVTMATGKGLNAGEEALAVVMALGITIQEGNSVGYFDAIRHWIKTGKYK